MIEMAWPRDSFRHSIAATNLSPKAYENWKEYQRTRIMEKAGHSEKLTLEEEEFIKDPDDLSSLEEYR